MNQRLTETPPLRIGVVIVTFNQVRFTLDCLKSLRGVSEPLSIVVVDNASNDNTPELVERNFPEVVVLRQEQNEGFAGGNNVGIRWCLEHACDAVLLLNNDTLVASDFLVALAEHTRNGYIAAPEIRDAISPNAVQDQLGWFDWRRGVATPLPHPPAAHPVLPPRAASGCCLLVPRQVFEKIGMLDESYFLYYEDIDFVMRAQLAGFELVREPRSVIYHFGSASAGPAGLSPLMVYYNTRNRLYLMQKFESMKPAFLCYFGTTRVAQVVRYLVRGKVSLVVAMLRAIRDFYTGRVARAPYWT